MPKEFLDCIKAGGKMFTIKPKGRPEISIPCCKIGGKVYKGEVHHKKGSRAEATQSAAQHLWSKE